MDRDRRFADESLVENSLTQCSAIKGGLSTAHDHFRSLIEFRLSASLLHDDPFS
ncbi:hypothetical protein HAX54_032695, partial [Datura stramonium]|nr:hypothetical protein [Datura stramonium]